MRIHRVFDIALASDFPFKNRLEAGAPPAEVTFECRPEAPLEIEWPGLRPVLASPLRARDGASVAGLFQFDGFEVFRFTGISDFYLGAERIDCHLRQPGLETLVEIQLLGSILSYWLERQGILALHASAVDIGGRAVGFLSSNHGGKTSVAAALMRRGHPLLTDDVLPIEDRDGTYFGRSGYPQMRMWPDLAAHFLGRRQDLERVHPDCSKKRVAAEDLGAFCAEARALDRLYLPLRRPAGTAGDSVETTTLSPRDALIELVRHSFAPLYVESTRWQDRRFEFLARLVEHIPVTRLDYPSGLEHLPVVCDHLERDLEDRDRSARRPATGSGGPDPAARLPGCG